MLNKPKIAHLALLAGLLGSACDARVSRGEAWDGPDPAGHGSPAIGEDDADDPPAREEAGGDGDSEGGATTGPLDDPPQSDTGEATGGPADDGSDSGDTPPDGADETAGEDPADLGDPECDDVGFLAEVYSDCEQGEVFAAGCCWQDYADSCKALDCDEGECYALTSVPMQAACVSHE